MMLYRKTIFILIFLSFYATLYSQNVKKLFESDSILEIRITLPLKQVVNDIKERKQHASKLSYTLADGTVFDHNMNIKVRGKTRSLKQICTFPPLELRFNKEDARNSIFEDHEKIKLVTHCQNDKIYEEYLQKEYIVYKMYQKVSPYSFKVRLCHITYINANKPTQQSSHYGFLIERLKDVAKRNDMSVFKDSIRNRTVLNKDNLDKLTLFEFLIGNLDWSIAKGHNMKLIVGKKGSLPLAVPYDFDYSGLVDIPYAVPPGGSGISDVKTRVFTGFCRRDGYDTTVEFYKSIREDLYKEVNSANFLSGKTINNMNKYLRSFYKILDDPKAVDKKINKACRIKHKHAYE
jgi:hypothetical protein